LREQVVPDKTAMSSGMQVEDQERDRDGQHAVTESLDAVTLGQHPRRLPVH
jgi:hypothetical protein